MIENVAKSPSILEILSQKEDAFLNDWMHQIRSVARTSAVIEEGALRENCSKFLEAFRSGLEGKRFGDAGDANWRDLRDLLTKLSQQYASLGLTPSDAATFVFSFKAPLFRRLGETVPNAGVLATEIWAATELLDAFGLFTTEVFLASRETLIRHHQEEMLELSTPVVKLWKGILALPLIGMLDSARTQVVMESLLTAIVQANCQVAIVDITGVPTVDTIVAQHLLKTVTAARLMGVDCIISGIRPQIAQTIVHLGIDLSEITTKATLRDAFALALERTGQTLVSDSGAA